MAVDAIDLARDLRELIAALDRRTPRDNHAAEAEIAQDAAALRERAVQHLAALAKSPRRG